MGADIKAALHAIARHADRQFGPRPLNTLPNLVVMTDRAAQGEATHLADALPSGSIICLRDYQLTGRRDYAAKLAKACHHTNVRLMVAGDVSLALEVGAWGVHFPKRMWDQSVLDIARARNHNLAVSTAIHSRKAARSVVMGSRVMCDMAMVSPVFATHSHPGAPALGPVGLAGLLAELPVPAYALGGVTPGTIGRLSGLPLCGIAGIRFV